MATSEVQAPKLSRKKPRRKRLTFLVMGSIGKVLSFQVSARLLSVCVLFLVAYLVVSLYVINDYIRLRAVSTQTDQRVSLLEEENATQKKSLGKSGQHVALLEGYIRHLEEGADLSAPAKRDQQGAGAVKVVVPATPQKPEKPQLVDVTDMVIQKEGGSMSVGFKLVNTQPGEGAVGGYIHLVAIDKRSTPPKEWTYPQEKLEKGSPSSYRRGQIFLIQKFKQINARLQLGSPSESPSAIKVLVYDQAGEIMLEKEMDVAKGS